MEDKTPSNLSNALSNNLRRSANKENNLHHINSESIHLSTLAKRNQDLTKEINHLK